MALDADLIAILYKLVEVLITLHFFDQSRYGFQRLAMNHFKSIFTNVPIV